MDFEPESVEPRIGRLAEYEIRSKLKEELRFLHWYEPDALIIEELGICEGQARVDIAVLNGSIHGYEIKSPDDSLARLPQQIEFYGFTFDTVTLVYSGRRDEVVAKHIPEWWGMCRAERIEDKCQLLTVRPAVDNPGQHPYHLAQLLWREEVLLILEERELADGIRSKPRTVLWRRLADNIPLPDLKEVVREKLKSRVGWRQHPACSEHAALGCRAL